MEGMNGPHAQQFLPELTMRPAGWRSALVCDDVRHHTSWGPHDDKNEGARNTELRACMPSPAE